MAADGSVVSTLPGAAEDAEGAAGGSQFPHESKVVSVGGDGTLKLLRCSKSGASILEQHNVGDDCLNTVIMLSSGHVAAAGKKGVVYIFWVNDTDPPTLLCTLSRGSKPIHCLLEVAGGFLLAGGEDTHILVWTIGGHWAFHGRLSGHKASVYTMLELGAGAALTGGADNTLRLWDVASLSSVTSAQVGAVVTCLVPAGAHEPDSQSITSGAAAEGSPATQSSVDALVPNKTVHLAVGVLDGSAMRCRISSPSPTFTQGGVGVQLGMAGHPADSALCGVPLSCKAEDGRKLHCIALGTEAGSVLTLAQDLTRQVPSLTAMDPPSPPQLGSTVRCMLGMGDESALVGLANGSVARISWALRVDQPDVHYTAPVHAVLPKHTGKPWSGVNGMVLLQCTTAKDLAHALGATPAPRGAHQFGLLCTWAHCLGVGVAELGRAHAPLYRLLFHPTCTPLIRQLLLDATLGRDSPPPGVDPAALADLPGSLRQGEREGAVTWRGLVRTHLHCAFFNTWLQALLPFMVGPPETEDAPEGEPNPPPTPQPALPTKQVWTSDVLKAWGKVGGSAEDEEQGILCQGALLHAFVQQAHALNTAACAAEKATAAAEAKAAEKATAAAEATAAEGGSNAAGGTTSTEDVKFTLNLAANDGPPTFEGEGSLRSALVTLDMLVCCLLQEGGVDLKSPRGVPQGWNLRQELLRGGLVVSWSLVQACAGWDEGEDLLGGSAQVAHALMAHSTARVYAPPANGASPVTTTLRAVAERGSLMVSASASISPGSAVSPSFTTPSNPSEDGSGAATGAG